MDCGRRVPSGASHGGGFPRRRRRHNGIHNTSQRNPSAGNLLYAHLDDNSGYGNDARGATEMLIENSHFGKFKDRYYADATAPLRQSGSILAGCTGRPPSHAHAPEAATPLSAGDTDRPSPESVIAAARRDRSSGWAPDRS